MKNKNILSVAGLVVILVLLLGVNILSAGALKSLRLDLTATSLYTLSDGAKNILGKLEEPISLRFYFSKSVARDYPGLVSYARQVEELLGEFERRAGGKLQVEVIDPEPFTEAEDRAVQYGLQGVSVRGSADPLYFGLAGANSVDDEEIIPFFIQDRERFLEYDLTELVWRLSNPVRPVLGVLSTLPLEGQMTNPMNPQPPEPWPIMDSIRRSFETRRVMAGAAEINEEIDILLVVHPKELSPQTLYAIDQFVLGGGRAVVLVDPHAEFEEVPRDPNNPMASMFVEKSSDLPELFDAWGIDLVDGKLVGDLANAPFAQQVRDPETGRAREVRNPLTLRMLGECFNQDETVTSRLNTGVNLTTVGCLVPRQGSTTTVTPLFESSEESMLVDESQVRFQADLSAINRDFVPTRQRYAMACRIEGPAQSAFPDGPPAPEGGEEGPAAAEGHLAASEGPINAIVVADVDFLHHALWAQPINMPGQRQPMYLSLADNANFLINALDYLAGSSDMISLRGRGGFTRPFTRVEEIRLEAQKEYRDREQLLTARLEETERQLGELQRGKAEGQEYILSPEQEAQIEQFRADQAETRKRLRDVQHEMRKDIDSLHRWLRNLNIFGVPILIVVSAVGLWSFRRTRRS